MLFKLIKQFGGLDYYKERTNLEIRVQYPEIPRGHPKVGELIPDYSGTAKVTEEEQTTYYDGVDGASTLPKNITITNGIGKISIDSVSNNTISNGEIVWPIKAKVKVELDNVGSIDEYLVEQWVKDSDQIVSENLFQSNNPSTPDWLEKQVWDQIRNYRTVVGITGTVMLGIKNVYVARSDGIDRGACAYVPDGNKQSIYIGVSCDKMHRKNNEKELSDTVIHESRHTWQHKQVNPEIDSDDDGCPRIVANGTEAGPNESSSIQDGISPTNGDDFDDSLGPLGDDFYSVNPYTLEPNDPVVSRCGYLKERDSVEFANDHK